MSIINPEVKNDKLFIEISELINKAKISVVKHINTEIVKTYFNIGQKIVEDEQNGEARAKYGSQTLKELSVKLTCEFGTGYSERRLREIRQVYLCFGIRRTVSAESKSVNISWSSYLLLSGIKDETKRNFYYVEAINNKWLHSELKRQFNSALFERIALSKNKEDLLSLMEVGTQLEKPQDIIKSVTVLEFLNLNDNLKYSESDLEQAIIDNLENFLLEMGRGFTFVKRQHAIKNRDKTYHADLVLYNRLLQCFFIIDLKINELTHGDIGQMLMYVNYFDQEIKEQWEKPTIGLLLCLENDDFIVKYTINDKDNIYASEYKLILPNQKELEKQVRDSVRRINEEREDLKTQTND